MDQVPTIVVNRDEIFVNDNKVVELQNGKVPAKDLDQGAMFDQSSRNCKSCRFKTRKLRKKLSNDTDKKKSDPGTLT